MLRLLIFMLTIDTVVLQSAIYVIILLFVPLVLILFSLFLPFLEYLRMFYHFTVALLLAYFFISLLKRSIEYTFSISLNLISNVMLLFM